MARHRRRWRIWRRHLDPAALGFLDETRASTNMVSRYGWWPKGWRLVDAVPHGHWKITACLAGPRSSGIVAPRVLDGPTTGSTFHAQVRQFLVPTRAPGDVVVMDSTQGGRHSRSRRRCRRRPPVPAALLARPIEQVFAKLKTLPRQAAVRTRETLQSTIGHRLATSSAAERANYLENAGYAAN